MTVLVGHPTGNPNSHNAALAYFEAGVLECYCVPWMPSMKTIGAFTSVPPFRPLAQRLARRHVSSLAHIPKVQGRVGEAWRLLMRVLEVANGHSEQANRWLMRTMARECHRASVTAVHAYEDCSLLPFVEAKRLGKACVYDLPTCYYPAWQRTKAELSRHYADWLPAEEFDAGDLIRMEHKRQEMELADLVLVASHFVEDTVREFHPQKEIAKAPYGVDLEFWTPAPASKPCRPLRFIYAGQVSVRKGVPLLIDAWKKAALNDAELLLVGLWQLAEVKRISLPPSIQWLPPCSPQALRDRYWESDIIVFPSFSDGFGLVLLEGMACGLPAIASRASGGPELITPNCGRIFTTGELDCLLEIFRWFDRNRHEIPQMSRAARAQAERCPWENYRGLVTQAVAKVA
jgi:glycosyltransferase involved in cell wall biosynthesis